MIKIKNSVIDPYESGMGEYRKSAMIHYPFINETNVIKYLNYAQNHMHLTLLQLKANEKMI